MATKKAVRSHTRKRKKIRYRKVEFKITEQQKKLIVRYCRVNRMTPVRMIKKALLEYLERHAADMPEEVVVSKNQLKLFDMDEEPKPEQQTAIFN